MMSILNQHSNVSNVSNGCFKFPVLATNHICKGVSRYYGENTISKLCNAMIQSMTGNATLYDANVICLSDFHYDPLQKYVRSQIINEVLHARDATDKKVYFLLEGVDAECAPSDWMYDRLVGNGCILFQHFVAGWDNKELNNSGILLVKEMQKLRLEHNTMNEKKKELEAERLKVIRDSTCSLDKTPLDKTPLDKTPLEKTFEKIDLIEEQLTSLSLESKDVEERIKAVFDEVLSISKKRNTYLYNTINKILKKDKQALIFVIGGANHFKELSTGICARHCILKIHELRAVTDIDQALKEVYGGVDHGEVD